jgi:hypothetical protein
MGKLSFKPNESANQTLEDLSNFLEFCREYGYRFNENDLYNFRSYAWQQYNKVVQGKNAKNMWVEDARRFGKSN